MERIAHWVDGAAKPGASGVQGEVFDPATGEVIALVDYASAAEVEGAVDVAAGAFRTWGWSSLSTRTQVLFRFRALLDANRGELAAAITRQHGKVLDDARGEVSRGIEVVEFACGIPQLIQGGFSAGVSSEIDSYTFRQPLGVVAGISPFNFPVMVPMWMHPLAIACGNTFVLKPSERDPGASMLVARLWKQAGLPDGVFNVVHGDRVTVEALIASARLSAVSFVGSTPVARSIHLAASAAGKKVQALGGAKNHMVVLPDADMEAAADAAVSAAFGSAGERCMAVSVVIAVGPAADNLVAAVTNRAARIEVGPGDRVGVGMGPLITAAHRDRVVALVGDGEREGALLVLDGRGAAVQDHPNGFWLGPCVLDGVRPEMKAYQEEIFGPVLQVIRAGSLDEAIQVINRNPYGNGTAIFTASGGAARRFEQEVQVGMIGVNVPIPVPTAHYSFGGWKDSLFGESHIYGEDGVRFYTRAKVVTRRWPEARSKGVDLAFPGQPRR